MKDGYSRVIGIDVSMDTLEISDSKSKCTGKIDNSPDCIKRLVVAKIKSTEETLVVCEATGGLEYDLVDLLQEAGIPVVIANPAQMRNFAKGHGYLEKTDVIDAQVIRLFGEQVNATPAIPRTEEQKQLTALTRRRSQVIDLLNQEKNRGKQCRHALSQKWIKKSIKSLENQLKLVDEAIVELLDQMAQNNPTVGILLSAKGIGYTTTAVLMGELPEIGTISRTQIAKLAGLAPIAMQSGREDRKRSVRGGRANVRTALYMPTMSAMRYNPTISQFARRLERKGKPHKVVVTACMRKLLTILNLMVKNQTMWDENKKGDERVSSPPPACSIGS
jgi:transposase